MMLLVTWTSSIGMVEGTVEREDEEQDESRVGEKEREKGRRNGKEVRKIRRKEGKEWKEREENEEEGKGSEEIDRGSIPTPSMQLTSLQSGDRCTDIPPTDISVLGRHSVLTTHKHHILCEWCETCDHTLSHVDSTIYGRRL